MKFNKIYFFNKLRLFFCYLEFIYVELQNITWQKNSDIFRYTFVVILLVTIVSFFLWFFDMCFVKFLSWLIF